MDGKDNENAGQLFASVYNKKRESVLVNLQNIEHELGRRSHTRCLLMMNKVWFGTALGKYGITVNAKQLMIYPNKEEICMFNENSSDEESDEEVDEQLEQVLEASEEEET